MCCQDNFEFSPEGAGEQTGPAFLRLRSRCLAVLILFVAGCGPTGATGEAWFVEEAQSRGIVFEHQSGFAGRPLLPEITAGGGALVDVDGDGDLDVYLVQSGSLHPAVRNDDYPGNKLFLNDGTGRFAEVPNANGADDRGYGMGVAAGDYDNDGDTDLYVTNMGPNALLRNDGTGTFRDVAGAAGVADPNWSTSAAFLDFDADGDLDLFVTNYINWALDIEISCYFGNVPTYCPPSNYRSPARDRLYRNNGDGTFADVSRASGISDVFGNGFGVIGGDFNADGHTDLFVANDLNPDLLWLNRRRQDVAGALVFEEVGALWGAAVDEHGIAKAGMGVAAADVDDDGDTDVMVTNIEGQTDSFFRNEGTFFRDVTGALGLGLTGRHTRWGVVLADFDNDGVLDLYEANGMVGTEAPSENLVFDEPNVLFRGTREADGGNVRFEEVRPQGGVSPSLVHTSRGVAVGDVDGDGGLDLLVVNRDGPAYLLLNQVSSLGNWIRFEVVLDIPQRAAHGATVAVTVAGRRRQADVRPEGSYLTSSDPRVHFGLGEATGVSDVTVRWPGETAVEAFGDFAAGQTVVLRRGRGTSERGSTAPAS